MYIYIYIYIYIHAKKKWVDRVNWVWRTATLYHSMLQCIIITLIHYIIVYESILCYITLYYNVL